MRWKRRSAAGRFAQRRYRLLHSRYRRRAVPPAAVVLVPLTVACLVLSLTARGWLAWWAASCFGGLVVLCLYVWDTVPAHIGRWAAGAAGERRTARTLRRLKLADWQLVHDLERPGGGNIDHLAVGPSGVFVLDSKAWGGVVRVDPDGVTVTPRDNLDAAWTLRLPSAGLASAAALVARALAAATGRAVPAPQPVVVVWAPFPQRVAVHRGVTYVAGDQLADWLGCQPRQLSRSAMAAFSAAVSDPQLLGAPPVASSSRRG